MREGVPSGGLFWERRDDARRRCEGEIVAFNALPCDGSSAGISAYICELLHALRPLLDGRMIAVASRPGLADLPEGVDTLLRGASKGTRRALQGLRDLRGVSVFHGLDVDLPAFTRAATVSTVHDLAVFDVPWAFSRHRVVGERLLITSALRRADAVIAVSDFTAQRLWERFRIEANVIPEAPGSTMVPPAASEVRRVRLKYQLPDLFAFHVGTCEPRKDVASIAEACSLAGIPLVVAGPPGWKVGAPRDTISLGFVPSSDLRALYGAATMSVYFSCYEGFGLPPVDSMACGCPVVSSKVPSVELVGGAVVVPSGRLERLAKVLRELMNDEQQREELAAAGQSAVRSLSWRVAAEATTRVYARLGVSLPAAS